MDRIRKTAVGIGMFIGALCSGSAYAIPVSSGGTITLVGAELVHWHSSRHRHVGPRSGRCWWENRRVRDHRGRWVVRRVHVCIR